MMEQKPVIVWFRNDLRIADNPALHAAGESGAPVIALYVLDQTLPHALGAASRLWLHRSLSALGEALKGVGTPLILRRGESRNALEQCIEETGANRIYWNRRHFPGHIEIDKSIKCALKAAGVSVETFNGNLLREPWQMRTKSGTPYRVYTPFWKALREIGPVRSGTLPRLHKICGPRNHIWGDKLDSWDLTPKNPDWAGGIEENWTPGEQGALENFDRFLSTAINHYTDGRDRPDHDYTSRLSPHLAFGEISSLQIWEAMHARMQSGAVGDIQGEKFLSEIAWREFAHHLLFHNDNMLEEPLRKEFADYPWRHDEPAFTAWTRGKTGYPIVDAGMRQLWQTGWMHNRVRMIAASFLTKNLLIAWQKGADWFQDTLVDADLASNAAGWQWVAGSGADAAPYFRIFNPVLQARKFDPAGAFVRKYVPELKNMPDQYIHAPWSAPTEVLQKSGVTLGKTYPNPIVDHGYARKRALSGYEMMRKR